MIIQGYSFNVPGDLLTLKGLVKANGADAVLKDILNKREDWFYYIKTAPINMFNVDDIAELPPVLTNLQKAIDNSAVSACKYINNNAKDILEALKEQYKEQFSGVNELLKNHAADDVCCLALITLVTANFGLPFKVKGNEKDNKNENETIKEEKTKANEDEIEKEEEIFVSASLPKKPQETIDNKAGFQIVSNEFGAALYYKGIFVKSMKTLAIGHGVYAYKQAGNVITGTIAGNTINERPCDAVEIALDHANDLIYIKSPEKNNRNLIAISDIEYPDDFSCVSISFKRAQYAFLSDDGRIVTNIPITGDSPLADAVSGDKKLVNVWVAHNFIMAVNEDRELITSNEKTGYKGVKKACYNGKSMAILGLDGCLRLNNSEAVAFTDVVDMEFCEKGLVVHSKDGIALLNGQNNKYQELVRGEIIEMAVSDDGIIYRKRNLNVDKYIF